MKRLTKAQQKLVTENLVFLERVVMGVSKKRGHVSNQEDRELTREEVDALAKRAMEDVDPRSVKSPTLRRLIEDARGEGPPDARVYNRHHNKHNRSMRSDPPPESAAARFARWRRENDERSTRAQSQEAYHVWIEENYPGESGYGKCAEATERMVVEFPELRRVRGHYFCSAWLWREHWWCVAADGAVVDPTAGQFPSRGVGEYREWDESKPEPTGRCPNCGKYCYDGRTCCSDRCTTEYQAYIRSSLNGGV